MDRAEVIRERRSLPSTALDATDHKDTVTAINCSVPVRQFDVAGDRRAVRLGFNPMKASQICRHGSIGSRQDSQDVFTYIRSLSAGK